MEVYAGTIGRAKHTIYFDGDVVEADAAVVLTIYDREDFILLQQPATFVQAGQFDDFDSYYYVTIGQEITGDYELKTLEWEYQISGNEVVTPREFLVVVNPYVRYNDFKLMYPQTNLDYKEFALVEPVVRKVIETYCNQTFTRSDAESFSIKGQNSDSLPLPRQIISLDSVQVLDPSIDADGNETPYDITEYVTVDDDDRWHIRRRTFWPVDRSLSPTNRRSLFKYPMRYRVTGSWGWDMVPEDVARAAAILVNDYECSDAKYREKYIANIRAGDWRMEFIATGDETTGNANADMILSRFRNVGLAVI